MELILFLLLGGVLFTRVGVDKSETKKADQAACQRLDWHRARLEGWRELVADKALEEDLADLINDPANYEDVWAEVHDAYLRMPSCKLFTRILLYSTMVKQLRGATYTKKQQETIAASNRQDALDIMLARRGKVRYINTCDGWHIKDLMPGHGESSKRAWDEAFDLWVYIRDELRRNGVPAKLIFQTGEIEEFKRTAYDADDVEKFRYMSGSLTWLPLTNFDHNLDYV